MFQPNPIYTEMTKFFKLTHCNNRMYVCTFCFLSVAFEPLLHILPLPLFIYLYILSNIRLNKEPTKIKIEKKINSYVSESSSFSPV